jgi:hypothetical protein
MALQIVYREVARLRVKGLTWKQISKIVGRNASGLCHYCHNSREYLEYEALCLQRAEAEAVSSTARYMDAVIARGAAEIYLARRNRMAAMHARVIASGH